VAFSDGEFVGLKNTAIEFRKMGYTIDVLNHQEVISVEPHISTSVIGALHLPEPCVDTEQLFEACKKSAEIKGCRIVPNTKITDILTKEKQAVGIRTENGDTHDADLIIVATGVDSPKLEGLEICQLHRVRGEALEVKGPPGYLRHQLYGGRTDLPMKGFITPRRDGRLLLGASYETNPDDGNPSTISVRLAAMTLEANLSLLPGLKDKENGDNGRDLFQITKIWKGWRAKSPDSQPIIGKSEIEGLYLAVGLFGLGVTMAPMVASTISNLIKGQETFYPVDIRPERYGI